MKKWRRFLGALLLGFSLLSPGLATAASITPTEFFAWAERIFPDIFPQGPVTLRAVYPPPPAQGRLYDYRFYQTNGGVYLAVGADDQHVFVLNVSDLAAGRTNPVDFGHVDKWKCDARPDLEGCGTAGFAGTVVFSGSSGTNVTFVPNYVNGKLTWLGYRNAQGVGVGVEVPLADVAVVCVYSDRFSNFGAKSGPGCSVPQANGELRISIPNNACVRPVVWTKLNELRWLDFSDPRGWRFTGLGAKVNPACGIEYGGFTPAKITAVREPDGTASLVWDFGSDFVGGVSRDVIVNGVKTNVSAVFDLADRSKVYAFVLNGSHAGKDYKDGWGLGEGRKTAAGDVISPSVKMAWLQKVDGRFIVKFANLDCADEVNITAYLGSGPADKVVYDFGADGYGLGWGSLSSIDPVTGGVIPSAFWTAGPGVSFVPATGKVRYGVPFCTKK